VLDDHYVSLVSMCPGAGAADTASPLLLEHVRGLLARHSIGLLVLGWPLGPQGQLTPECRRVEAFARALQAANVRSARLQIAPACRDGLGGCTCLICFLLGMTPTAVAVLPTAPLSLPLQVLVPVTAWDERGSTARARAILRAPSSSSSGSNGAAATGRWRTTARKPVVAVERRHLTDGVAAALILEDFLAFARSSEANRAT
jgi:RNase H-fold protein (predicted Holliday junction resolvase)